MYIDMLLWFLPGQVQSQLAAEATPMEVPSEQKAGTPTSIKAGSCFSFLCAGNAMSSYCVLQQCYCGPEVDFEDAPGETAREGEGHLLEASPICFSMFPSVLAS